MVPRAWLAGAGAAIVALAAVGAGAGAWGAGSGVGLRHPVLPHDLDRQRAAEYEAAVRPFMALPESDVLSYVPRCGYASYCECPNCYGGVEGNYVVIWDPARPDELKCRFCGTVVYPNPRFPEDRVLVGKNRLGEEIRFPYHLNERTGVAHFFSTHLMLYKRRWLLQQCLALGKAYQATGKEKYAYRVALVLDHAARLYPHYPVMQNLPRVFAFRESQEPPYPWDSGRWGYFYSEIPTEVILCYDLIYDSKALDQLSRERGYDVRERIERDFLRPTFDSVAARPDHVGNTVGYDVRSAALLGRVIGEPRYVHWAFGWMKANVNAGFFRDGMWPEAPSYHYMATDGLRIAFESVRGYSDPPGYLDPVDRTRFDHLDPERALPFWARVQRAPETIAFPNGMSHPVHDTHPYERRSQPTSRTASALLPAYGHAMLGRGTGENQMQAHLHFSGSYGHEHFDNLNLTLWAKGREMLPDLGYTWTQMRHWATSTLGHNTVVVDRKDQGGRPSDGDLVCFFADAHGVSLAEADGKRAYANIPGVETYRRLIALVPVSPADAYVVDIFRVRGGSRHDWAMHGDADEDTTAQCSLTLGERRATMLDPGEEWVEPTIEGATYNPYGMLRDMRGAPAGRGFSVTFAYAGTPARGMRLHMLPGGPAELWLGRSPSVRRMGQGAAGDMRKAYDFWMPQLLVRREGVAPLMSTFVAIEEPYVARPFITSVAAVPVTPADDGCVAVQVRHGDIVDTLVSTLDEPPFPMRALPGGLRLRGRTGLVRQRGTRVVDAWLFDGEALSGKGWRVALPRARFTGTVLEETRKADGAAEDAFITEAVLPTGTALRGLWMVVSHGNGIRQGHRVARVERRGGRTVVVLDGDHGLVVDPHGAREARFPRRELPGPVTFTIPRSALLGKPTSGAHTAARKGFSASP